MLKDFGDALRLFGAGLQGDAQTQNAILQKRALSDLANEIGGTGMPDRSGIIWNTPMDKQRALMKYAQITGDLNPILGVGGSQAPSAVQEYQFFSNLTPEQQQKYLGVKRAGQIIDTGAGYSAYNPITGSVTPVVGKELAPEQRPETKGQQAAAAESGKLKAEEEFTSGKANEQTFSNLDAFKALEDVSKEAPSGTLSNIATSAGEFLGLGTEDAKAQGRFKAAVANAENLARAAFRVAGSGATSDRDAQPIIDLLPNINDSAEVKVEKIKQAKKALISKANATAKAKGKPAPFDSEGNPLFAMNAEQQNKNNMTIEQKRARLEELRRKAQGQ